MRIPVASLFLGAGLLAASMASATPAAAEPPKVVVSVKPLHALVAAVMQGVGQPALLVRGGASPHDYALKPSDARALQEADLVVWVGEGLEGFLIKPLAALPPSTTVVEAMDSPGLTLLEARKGGTWEAHEHGHAHGHQHAGADHGDLNPHVWLDPANARAIADTVAVALAARDVAHADAYKANAAALGQRLEALDAEMEAALAPVADKPFVVFHDAYQYFEARYGLNAVGSITVNPEQRPSARRIEQIRARIKGLGAACVFAEPSFEPRLVDTVVEGTSARKGTLDPEGAALPEGPELYPALMRALAKGLRDCLGA